MAKDKGLVWTPHPVLPIPDMEMIISNGWDKNVMGMVSYHQKREDHIRAMKDDPYRNGHELDHWLKADLLLKDKSEILCMGGNRCISGDSEIYDPLIGKHRKVSEIDSNFYVRSWDGEETVSTIAHKPFIKGYEQMYKVELSNGRSIECTINHRLLTHQGYSSLKELSVGDSLLRATSCDLLDSCTGGDSGGDYQTYPHLYDEQPHPLPYTDQSASPFRVDEEIYDHQTGNLGDMEHEPYNTHHDYPLSGGTEYHSLRRQASQPHQSRQTPSQCHYRSFLNTALTYIRQFCSELRNACLRLSLCHYACNTSVSYDSSSQEPSLHKVAFSQPLVDPLSDNRNSLYSCSEYWYITSIIATTKQDVWDFHVPEYNNYEMGGVFSHNSGKSEYAGKRVVQCAVNNPNSIIWCFQSTFENSVQMQQKIIWRYIPPEMKLKKKGAVQYISYSQKMGFSGSKLVFPNGSEIVFRNYSQDVTTIEGGEVGSMTPVTDVDHVFNFGWWADELIPQPWLETLRYRLVTRDAKGILTFTAIEGYSPTVKEYLNGCKTIEQVEADLLPGTMVPIVQQPKREDSIIIYFHTKDNPYGGYDRIVKTLKGAHRDEILCRAYGVPVKPMAGKFPKFSDMHNVIKHEDIPWIKDPSQKVTHYMCIDPSGAKPYFMLWVGVTEMDEVYVWAEYPDISYGEWADMSKGTRGRLGDGAKPNGNGYLDYKDVIDNIEDGVKIFERLIDSRAGSTRYQSEQCQTCCIDELINVGLDVIPASGLDEDQGIQAINKYLAWDNTKPMHIGNKPRLFISDRCEQLIYAMTEYTGMLGKDEPTKDPIDCLRYLLIGNIMFIDDAESHFLRKSRH